jgi:starch-binding outer membrane protein, SusD/RagB family
MKMKITIKILAVAMLFVFASCESLLEVNPKQSVDSSDALTTTEGIRSNLANIYSYLKTTVMYGRDYVATAEALADNTRIINRAGGRYQAQGSNVVNNHLGNWEFAYAGINEINLLLKALPTADISATFRDETEGQVKALRALMYFDLVRTYAYEPGMAPAGLDRGGVPLMLDGIISEDQIVLAPRASVADVYAQIYADLTDAIAKAPTSGGPAYITKAAANAIFAKVALYNRDWANAEAYATAALALKSTLSTNASYVNDWRVASHPESVFEILFKNPNESIGVNESNQSAFTTRESLTGTNIAGYGAVVPTTAFYNSYSASDVRRNLYQNGLARSGTIVIECTKYFGKTGTIYMDNIPVIRVSELYLIRAEARAMQGTKDTEALADLNVITQRAGLPAYGALTGTALVAAIIEQRRWELAFEGDRWFDMKRRGQPFMKSTGNVLYDDFRILAPIPVREIQSNTNLVQNLGY